MIFSKTTEYALRIMSFLAIDEKRLISSKEISRSVNVPFRYLRKLLLVLTKSGLIDSVQGKNGGYKIAKILSDISILDIIHAVGVDQIKNECFFGFQNCAFINKCAIHDKWTAVQEHINNVLTTTSLAELKETGHHSLISKQ